MALINKLTAIANGFRASRGTTDELSLDEMATLAAEPSIVTQQKSVDITSNGTTEITPDEGYALSKITANVNVPNKLPQVVDRTVTEITAEDLEGATNIGTHAFYECDNLTSVTIPNSVTSIGYSAFRVCRSLTSVTIGDSVTSIGQEAFAFCYKLTSITIPNSVTSIGQEAFAHGEALSNDLIIPESVTSIGNRAFRNQVIPSLTLNGGGKIGEEVFASCGSLKTVTIGNKVTVLGSSAFLYCNSLESVTIGNGVESIGSSAFNSCPKLTNFSIASPISASIRFFSSTLLTIDSLKNIINALVDYSGTENEGKYKLTLNSSCNARLDTEGATAPNGLTWIEYAQAKGWNIA